MPAQGLLGVSEQSAERLSDSSQGDVVMPSAVAAPFEVIEADSVFFEFPVVVFDPPADLGQSDQLAERRVEREVG
jgi:hypothetical protein